MSAASRAAAMIRLVRSMWSAAGATGAPPPDPAGPAAGRGAAARMAASSSAGAALVIWAAAVDPADVPMIRSAPVTSRPASSRPAMTPISHALPADPPPWRTSARPPAPEEGGGAEEGAEEGVVFMGAAFRDVPGGRSRSRLPQSRDRGRRGSTRCGYCVHGAHLLPTDHDHRNDRTPATRSATGIQPAAAPPPNAPHRPARPQHRPAARPPYPPYPTRRSSCPATFSNSASWAGVSSRRHAPGSSAWRPG